MINLQHKAFNKGLSSVFIVSSPLQILCVVEAIKEFDITDYLIVFQCQPGEIRNAQVSKMLDDFNLKHEIFNVPEGCSELRLSLHFFLKKRSKQYDRVFIGDYNNLLSHAIGLSYISFNSHVVYLDDGTATIPVLKDIILYDSLRYRLERMILFFFYLLNFVQIFKYFFTLYFDIETSKTVYPNKFIHLFESAESKECGVDVYFIGTNSWRYAECYLDNDEELYKRILFGVLKSVKEDNPNCRVYYIPHGRDDREYIKTFCDENAIVYKRLSESVESFFVNNKIFPGSVYGFVSSALFNLKKMFPQTRVVNYYPVVSKSSWRVKNIETSLYYEKHGIEYFYIDADGVIE